MARTLIHSKLFVFCSAVALHGALALYRGVQHSADSITFSQWADRLLSSGFDFAAFAATPHAGYPPMFYAGWVALVALTKLTFRDHWPVVIVILNVVANALVVTLIVRTVLLVTRRDVLGGWCALALSIGCFDMLQWTSFVLSDSSFLLFSFASFAAASRARFDARPILCLTLAAVLSIVACIYRPNGILVPLALLSSFLLVKVSSDMRRLSVIVCLVVFTAIIVLNAALVQNVTRWPGQGVPTALELHASLYQRGIVVFDRPNTYHSRPEALSDYILLSLDRLAHFFYFMNPSFSRAHDLIAGLFFLPAYALALVAVVTAMRGRFDPVVLMSMTFVILFWFFTSLVQIDFDWRYRVPTLPHLIFLAGVGAVELPLRLQRTSDGAMETVRS